MIGSTDSKTSLCGFLICSAAITFFWSHSPGFSTGKWIASGGGGGGADFGAAAGSSAEALRLVSARAPAARAPPFRKSLLFMVPPRVVTNRGTIPPDEDGAQWGRPGVAGGAAGDGRLLGGHLAARCL